MYVATTPTACLNIFFIAEDESSKSSFINAIDIQSLCRSTSSSFQDSNCLFLCYLCLQYIEAVLDVYVLIIYTAAQETAKLVQELQTIAHQAGHPVPLLIALDQENGGVNSLFDEESICQFPSAMGIAATGSLELAYEIANATAKEVGAVGVNMIMGPVLDVLTNARYQPLGVRATGDDPQEVSQYGIAAMNGYKDAGLTTCGKHFPSYGNLDFLGSSLDMPIITETIEQLSLSALVPFRNAIRDGIDAMMVGGKL